MKYFILLFIFSVVTFQVKAQDAPTWKWDYSTPSLTSCPSNSGENINICIGKVSSSSGKSDVAFCIGSKNGECPSAAECIQESVNKTKDKQWLQYSISGNNKLNPAGGASIPATKSCRFSPGEEKPFNMSYKLINIQCGNSPLYLMAENENGDATKELSPTKLSIDGKEIDLTKFKEHNVPAGFYWLWKAISKQTVDNTLGNSGIKTIKAAGEENILKELKDQGVDLKSIDDSTFIDFSYTPATKNPEDQARFFYKGAKITPVTVCEGSSKSGSYFYTEPKEFMISECKESIIYGTAAVDVGGNTTESTVACFAKKDDLYCADAKTCLNDGYSQNKLVFKAPTTPTNGSQNVPSTVTPD